MVNGDSLLRVLLLVCHIARMVFPALAQNWTHVREKAQIHQLQRNRTHKNDPILSSNTSEAIDLDPAAVVAFRGARVPPLSWMTSPADLQQRFPEHIPVLVTLQLEGTVGTPQEAGLQAAPNPFIGE